MSKSLLVCLCVAIIVFSEEPSVVIVAAFIAVAVQISKIADSLDGDRFG